MEKTNNINIINKMLKGRGGDSVNQHKAKLKRKARAKRKVALKSKTYNRQYNK